MEKPIPNGWLQQRGGKPDDVIVDVGAHTGGYTHTYARWVPEGRVHAIEPGPRLFAVLTENTKVFPQVLRYNIGLADRVYEAKNQSFYHAWVIGPTGGFGGLAPSPDPLGGVFDVSFTTFDAFMDEHEPKRPSLVKIDVDGHEVKVLRGARKRLLEARVPMYFEFSFLVQNCGDTVDELLRLIFDAGYWVFPLLPNLVWEVLRTREELLSIFPWNTSWDASLIHREDPMLKTLGRGL